MGTMAEKGNAEKEFRLLFAFFFIFIFLLMESCANLTCLVTSEVINDCNFFFLFFFSFQYVVDVDQLYQLNKHL